MDDPDKHYSNSDNDDNYLTMHQSNLIKDQSAYWQRRTDGMFWPEFDSHMSHSPGTSSDTMNHRTTQVPAKWHPNPSNGSIMEYCA